MTAPEGPASENALARSQSSLRARPLLWAALALAVLLAGTAVATVFTARVADDNARKRVERDGGAAVQALDRRLVAYGDVLVAVRGLLEVDPHPSRARFAKFVRSLQIEERYPGVRTVSFARSVDEVALSGYVRGQRKAPRGRTDGYPPFAVHPRRRHPRRLMVLDRLEPIAGNEKALGLDLLTNPARAAAVERTLNTGRPAASAPTQLVQDPSGRPGFVFMLAVRDIGGPLTSARTGRLHGVVTAAFNIDELLGGALATRAEDHELEVYDVGLSTASAHAAPLAANLIHDSDRTPDAARGVDRRRALLSPLDIGGRRWLVYYAPRGGHASAPGGELPWIVAVAGTLGSLLASWLLLNLARGRTIALTLARRMTRDLERAERQTRQILETGHDAYVSIDAHGVIIEWNPQAQTTFGWSRDEAVGRVLADTIIPERFRDAHWLGIERFLAGASPTVLGRRIELPALHRDGRELPIEMTISATRTEDATTFHAFLHDISERKHAEDRMREDARVRAAISVATGALSLSADPGVARSAVCDAVRDLTRAAEVWLAEPDGDGRLVVTAAAGPEIPLVSVQIAREQSAMTVAFLARSPFFVADAASNPAVSARLAKLVGAASVFCYPVLLDDEAVGVISIWWTDTVVHPPEHVTAAVALLAGHAAAGIERSDLLARLESMVRTDALTGLPNRRAWDEALPREIERARRDKRPLTVAMLDMDHFSAYNEQHGHPGGDRLLKEAAAGWRSALRTVDTVARYGGEEFGLILPGAGPDEALAAIERARHATPAGQTCSAGIAHWDGSESAVALIARADRALYRAKQNGRNQAALA